MILAKAVEFENNRKKVLTARFKNVECAFLETPEAI